MNNSRAIISNQPGLHDKLESTVRRHLTSRFQRPFPDYSLQVFAEADRRVKAHGGEVILDSFCGIGESTVNLARQYPEALVIGIDKSSHRLQKHAAHFDTHNVSNYQLFQADVDDFWRLALQAGWQLSQHYVLYPNPWPKSSQLKRRVHGSPLFPTLLALGGQVELRSNWPVYVEEFGAALAIAGFSATVESFSPQPPVTPFERKYQASGQQLWRCISPLSRY